MPMLLLLPLLLVLLLLWRWWLPSLFFATTVMMELSSQGTWPRREKWLKLSSRAAISADDVEKDCPLSGL
jgi:hypothetical protein